VEATRRVSSQEEYTPLILIFSTSTISDPGIDFAGSSHIHYPSSTSIIRIPCSSMIRPEFIVYALQNGFEGVYVAADGPDCAYLGEECVSKTAQRVETAQKMLKEAGVEAERVKITGVCSVCGEAFAKSIRDFYSTLKKLGPLKGEMEVQA
jgi:F420-non-reducing hydrogenase iron-sulfur subunit